VKNLAHVQGQDKKKGAKRDEVAVGVARLAVICRC
jgi:hypothetical protein